MSSASRGNSSSGEYEPPSLRSRPVPKLGVANHCFIISPPDRKFPWTPTDFARSAALREQCSGRGGGCAPCQPQSVTTHMDREGERLILKQKPKTSMDEGRR